MCYHVSDKQTLQVLTTFYSKYTGFYNKKLDYLKYCTHGCCGIVSKFYCTWNVSLGNTAVTTSSLRYLGYIFILSPVASDNLLTITMSPTLIIMSTFVLFLLPFFLYFFPYLVLYFFRGCSSSLFICSDRYKRSIGKSWQITIKYFLRRLVCCFVYRSVQVFLNFKKFT